MVFVMFISDKHSDGKNAYLISSGLSKFIWSVRRAYKQRGSYPRGLYTDLESAPLFVGTSTTVIFGNHFKIEKIEFGGLIILSVQLLLLSRSSVQR